MHYARHKTKIVCTIGPASDSPEILQALLRAGMNIARLNFSHGDFASHAQTIARLREAAAITGLRLTILADLPGPKMRIGEIAVEPVELKSGDQITLTTENIIGDASRVSVTLAELPRAVKAEDKLFLNDGMISLKVIEVIGEDVRCEVRSGGELSSRKGLNLPGIDLGIRAFTARDQECLEFAMAQGVDAVSQSFVADADDIRAVRAAANALGGNPFVIAKIERAAALDCIDEILDVADGIMVARGDLGVEIPIARMTMVQKDLMRRAKAIGKPVITATQMLESMTTHRRPTRAEATDVANAILDGTDAVMLSGESAVGMYPVEAVEMLAEIAAETEPSRPWERADERMAKRPSVSELIAHNVQLVTKRLQPRAVVVPTRSGAMARNVARFRLPTWITAFSTNPATCQNLQFSYGVYPQRVDEEHLDWAPFVRGWLLQHGVDEGLVVLTQGPSPEFPCGNNRMEILDMGLGRCVPVS